MKKINKFKVISFLLSVMFIVSLMPIDFVHADKKTNTLESHEHTDECDHDVDGYSTSEVKPQIDIKYLGTNPVEPIQGLDFEVKYEITAHPFQHNITLPKEIVLVLDKSGSMKDNNKMTNLKKAAKEFINSLSKTIEGSNIPEISNLSIGIIAYDKYGYIRSELVQLTDDSNVYDKNKEILINTIDKIQADGGTNIGDGLRKGAYLLDKSNANANKTIIFMADGIPTYYSYYNENINIWNCICSRNSCGKTNKCTFDNSCKTNHGNWINPKYCSFSSQTQKKYYTTLDNTNPSYGGTGSSDDSEGNCLNYAKAIGSIIRDKSYNVYSIGYGLGNESTDANRKMKEIHESMGGISSGEGSTFFATDSGAIDSIFNKISDNLKKTYDNLDVKLNLNLGDTIVAGEGFEISDGNGNIVKVPEVVYNLGEKNWYTATPERRQIVFKVKANSAGDSISLFKPGSKLTYKDVNGDLIEVEIPEQTIKIKDYVPGEAEKLQVNFATEFTGYLVGDTVKANVTFIHPGSLANNISFTDAKFNIKSLPEGLVFAQDSSNELSFGTVGSNVTKPYYFKINNNENYTISGDFQYNMKKGSSNSVKQEGTLEDTINVKQGKVRVKVLDEQGTDITEYSIVSIKSSILDEYNGIYNIEDKFIDFNDKISTGNYELNIKSLPEGCTPKEDQDTGRVMVNYDNNIVEYIFNVDGVAPARTIEIEANLKGYSPSYPYLDEDITVSYEIDPKEFVGEDIGEILVANSKLIFDLGNNFSVIEGQGLVLGDDGKCILDFSDKIKYTYDSNNNKYVANKFTVSFKVKANISGQNISFNKGNIQYINVLSPNSDIITNTVEVPNMTIRNVEVVPEYNGPDIRILEIEPADSFKLTRSVTGTTKTGIEPGYDSEGNKQYITEVVNGKEYKVEVVHMTMSEFIGKVDDLNGKYDVIVIGNHVEKGINSKYNFTNTGSYIKSDGYEGYDNDITTRKGDEVTDFINSGQLVFIDKNIKDIQASKLKNYANNQWNVELPNLVINSTITDNSLNISQIVAKYDEITTINLAIKRPKLVSSNPNDDRENLPEEIGNIYKRNMRFDIKLDDLPDEEITINLYLDINGDGLFKKEEIVNSISDIKISNNEYRLDYDFYKDNPLFIGYLDWRLEIVRNPIGEYSKPIKSYYDNNLLFRRVSEEKRKINVLQVSPYSKSDIAGTSNHKKTNLSQNPTFIKLLSDLSDYDIDLDVISYSQFYTNDNYSELKDKQLKESKYNIIILGFGDTYKGRNLGSEAIKQLKEFVKSGQGLMLTHDTLFYEDHNLFKSFRDIAGQSRYVESNNSGELDIDGQSKIPHDKDVNAKDKNGNSLWKTYDAGGANGNSTRVYKINDSLLTSYPYYLGDEIIIRRTHGQYYELNLEDEEVVTSFTLTDYNRDQAGNTNKNAKADKYDVRNNYYTYSRGNITFSGTGEDGREDSYPQQELELFVNTIVKAERGANHKPEILALENISEIPYNSDLKFDTIVKDIDGDKIRINKIRIDSSDVDGYSDKTEFKVQGSTFPVIISQNNFKNKINNEVKITIEAEDSRGAIAVKEYTVIPVNNPLLTSEGGIVNSLVGENVDFEIELNRENDDSNSIVIESIEIPDKNQIVEFKNVDIKEEQGKLLLVGKLKALVEVTGQELSVIVNYKNGNQTIKNCEVKIILNSKYGNVNISVRPNNGSFSSLGLTPKVTLTNKTNSKVYEEYITATNGIINFNSIEGGSYSMLLDHIIGYNIISLYINNEQISIGEDKIVEFEVDFNNSSKNIDIVLSPQVSDLTHGLYQGVNNNGKLVIDEKESGFEMVAEMTVNFGSTFILGGSSPEINLSIDSNLRFTNVSEEINKNNVKVFKVTESNGKEVLSEISHNSLQIARVSSKYTIKILETVEANTKILISYSAKIPNKSKNQSFNNIIDISGKGKTVNVYTRDTGEKIEYLPDLF